MKTMNYFCAAISLMIINAANSYAFYVSHDTNLVEIKPNPTRVEPKPAFSSVKLASVTFITNDDASKFDFKLGNVQQQCAALGYPLKASSCKNGAAYAQALCSSHPDMLDNAEASLYTKGCCNPDYYNTTAACSNNHTAEVCVAYNGTKYNHCGCDKGVYPFSEDAGCPAGQVLNLANSCTETVHGITTTYYTSCCPSAYQECDASNHEVGSGGFCVGKNASGELVTKYEYCGCASHYDTVCGEGKLIDVSNVCRKGGLIYTRESNCESNCTKTSETNIDDYLYGNAWHCLWAGDGALLKSEEDGLCSGYNSNNTYQEDYYEDCKNQGYTKQSADCFNQDAMIRCPTNTSLVWCLEGNYCTNYPVGETNEGTACNISAANIDMCDNTGKRCSYLKEECNSCWSDGTFNASRCESAEYINDTSDDGNTQTCCLRGYKLKNGLCVANVCDKDKYPYDLNPGKDQGDLQVCYQGDTDASLGYTAYFGYNSCFSDKSLGGMWQQVGSSAPDNRKCACIRKNEDGGRTYLPFGLDRYFDTNSDTTDNYINVGFNQGAYGITSDCTDAEGSYYGYSSCYLGKKLGDTEATFGMCLQYPNQGNTVQYPYRWDRGQSRTYWDRVAREALGTRTDVVGYDSTKTLALPVPVYSVDPEKSECINMYHHCKNGDKTLGDAKACALVVPGCNLGNESECSVCFHRSNLVKKADGTYTTHDKYKLKLNTYSNTEMIFRFEECPAGFYKGGNYGSCFKYCKYNKLSECMFGDVITMDGTASGAKAGVVYYKTADKMYISAPTRKTGQTFDQALAYAAAYAPTGFESDTLFGTGKWHIAEKLEINSGILEQFSTYIMGSSFTAAGTAMTMESSWTSTENGASAAYYRNCCDTTTTYEKTKTLNAVPVVIIDKASWDR